MSELIDAVENGDIDLVRQLLDRGADIDFQGENGWTALMKASRNGNMEIVRLLLDRGADIDFQGTRAPALPALILASHNDYKDIVELLLDRGANPNIKNYYFGFTALIKATSNRNIQIVKLLLDHGADPNIPDENGWTTLMWASNRGFAEIVELLLNKGADPYIENNDGETALFLSQSKGRRWRELWRMDEPTEGLFWNHISAEYLNKLKAATTVQKTFRGKKTRKKKYIDRFKSYKPWKGTEAFNTILYDDEDVYKYLTENDRNFVIKFNQDYEAWNIDDYLKVIEIEGVNDINVFYECYEASGYTPENNINKDTIYIKLGAYNFVVEMPDWLLSIWIGLKGIPVGPNNKIPEPRIFGLVENKMVNALVSSNILEYGGSLVSGDHCNHSDPVMTYKLELLSEETIIADYLNALNLDQYGGRRRRRHRTMKKRYQLY